MVTSNPSPDSLSATVGRVEKCLELSVGYARKDAELVTAEPVAGCRLDAHDLGELCRQAREQRIAGRMAEEVVEALEPVEVVEHEHVRIVGAAGEHVVEVGDQPAAVPEMCERIGDREHLDAGRDRCVLPERQERSDQHEPDGRRGQDESEQVELTEVIVDEHGQRYQRADDRRRCQRSSLQLDPARAARADPGGNGEKDPHQRPQDVEQRSFLVGADRGGPQVDGVRHTRGEEGEADHHPLEPGRPAGQPEDAGDEREEHDVAERVGEIGGDRERLALGVVERHLQQEGRTDGARPPGRR